MRYSFLIFLGVFITLTLSSQELPSAIYVGGQSQHVQGIALDREAGYMYMSFTNSFVKADLQGNIVASIDVDKLTEEGGNPEGSEAPCKMPFRQ